MAYYVGGGIDLSCDAYYGDTQVSIALYSLAVTLPDTTEEDVVLTEDNFPLIGLRYVYTYVPTEAGDYGYKFAIDTPYPAVDKGTFTVEE